VLASGKVLFVGLGDRDNPGTITLADVFDPDAETWTAVGDDPDATSAARDATLLRDGTVLVTTSGVCPSTSESHNCDTNAQFFDPNGRGGLGAFSKPPIAMPALAGASTATLLPSGAVLFTAGGVPATDAQIYDPSTGKFVVDDRMASPHGGHTATLLPGG